MNENDIKTNVQTRLARPALSFYHPNAKGSGCAVAFEMIPARDRDAGCIFATFARQKTIGSRTSEERIMPTFDWKNKLCVKLEIPDLAQMLQVFRGEIESIADGKGLYHVSGVGSTVIRLEHRLEPVSGFSLDVVRKAIDGNSHLASIFFTTSEALAFSLAIEQSLGCLAFGIPTFADFRQERVGA